jgi:monoterpene epsilon-lactone hydrolase
MTADWHLPPLRTGHPADDDLAARRAGMAGVAPPDPAAGTPVDVRRQPTGGVDGVVCRPPDPVGVLVHFHGGGYRLGSALYSAAFGARLAMATSCTVVVPEYRLAPEHPFPAALHDAAAVYDAVLEAADAPVFVGGDSAGGGLAAALAVAGARAGRPAPRGLLLWSPWLDLRAEAPSFASRAETDLLFSRQSAAAAAASYLQGVDAAEPLASPLLAEVRGLPPTLVFAAEDEVLLDDSLSFAVALAHAGVPVETHFVPGVQHVWPVIAPDHPESTAAVAAAGRFVARLVAGPDADTTDRHPPLTRTGDQRD